MATLSQFRTQFPELKTQPDTLINAFLAAAALEMSSSTWGERYDQGQMYLAAHKLALSPAGVAAKLVMKVGDVPSSTYEIHYKKLQRQFGPSVMVP